MWVQPAQKIVLPYYKKRERESRRRGKERVGRGVARQGAARRTRGAAAGACCRVGARPPELRAWLPGLATVWAPGRRSSGHGHHARRGSHLGDRRCWMPHREEIEGRKKKLGRCGRGRRGRRGGRAGGAPSQSRDARAGGEAEVVVATGAFWPGACRHGRRSCGHYGRGRVRRGSGSDEILVIALFLSTA